MDSRKQGGLYGALIGDALGVPYEFRLASQLPEDTALEMQPPPGWRPTYGGVPPGTWSDDGALMLALADSLGTCDCLDLEDFSERMLSWWQRGHYTPDGRVFDIGNRTAASLAAIERGVPPQDSGGSEEQANGNGSLMRVLPLALWHPGSDAELVEDAIQQSLPTHAHPRSTLSCALYCLWIRGLLRGEDQAWDMAAFRLFELRQHPELATIVEDRPLRGSGYVLDSLHTARTLVEGADSYEEAVRAAIKLGEDTDTTACITGGAAGVRWGFEGLPSRWLGALKGRAICDPIIERLLRPAEPA